MTHGVFSMNALVIAFSILSSPADGATLAHHQQHDSVADEKRPALMRRDVQSEAEKESSLLEHREMTETMQQKEKSGDGHKKESSTVQTQTNIRMRDRFDELEALGHMVKNLRHSKSLDLCNDAYIAGPENTSNCSESWHSPIDSYTVCETGAQLECPDPTGGDTFTCIGDPFEIKDPSYKILYPKGCFKRQSDGKWFYNPVEPAPDSPNGIPICVEYEYQNGTASSVETCPEGYDTVMDEYVCRTAAQCQDYCIEVQFRVLDPAASLTAPKGCHINAAGCLMFNNESVSPTCSSDCVGIPMCNATVRTTTTTTAA